MRSPRRFMASLGAAAVLAVAGSVALLAVSALVAFHGWPGVRRTAGTQAVILPGGDGLSAASAGAPGRIALGGRVPGAGRGGARATGQALGHRGRESRSKRAGRPGAGGSGGGGPALGAGWVDGGTTFAAPSSVGAPTPVVVSHGPAGGGTDGDAGGPVHRVTHRVGGAVEGIGADVAHTVGPVSPKVGVDVQRTADAVGGTVQRAGSAADGLVHQAGDVVKQAGGAVGGAVQQAGSAVSGLLGGGR